MTTATKAQTKAIAAVIAAEAALNEAKALLGDLSPAPAPAQKSTSKSTSAGRIPTPEQTATRDKIIGLIDDGKLGLFTVKGLCDLAGLDRIQTRNAVTYLESKGIISRYAEKLPEGRGQRELIYRAASFEVVI